MRDYERLKLQEVVRHITNDGSNKQLVANFNVLRNGMEIVEPAVWITAADFRTLVKLARVPQELYKKTKDLPCVAIQKEVKNESGN